MYINCHSYYSLRYGTVSEKDIIDMAVADQAKTVALTDINNTSACLNFVRLAQEANIKPVLGIDFRQGVQQLYLALAQNNTGFQHLNHFLSAHKHQKKKLPHQAPDLPDTLIIYPLSQIEILDNRPLKVHEYIGIHRHELHKIPTRLHDQYRDRLIALNSYTFRHKKDFNTHRLLRAIDNNVLLSKLTKDQEASESDIYLTSSQLKSHYKNYTHILENTANILAQCHIEFDFSKSRPHQNKVTYTNCKQDDKKLLRALCKKGLKKRYKIPTKTILDRINKEITMIEKMEFVPFFLVNWDIINYAKQKGYYHVGRGSGANSIVAYLLGITDVDPIELDLYFERFMNLYRSNPPDFDIDFSWRDREDVTRYIFDRFGQQGQVALLATYNTFKHQAAVRELSKVFGLPKHEIDKLSHGKYIYQELDQIAQIVVKYARELSGRPNYLSIHAGGIIIAEKPIHYFTATDLPPKGFPTTQFDMVIAEDVGLYKYDILGQRGLGKIKDAIQLVRTNKPEAPAIDIHDVKPFFLDKNINKLISEAKCIGCFYVESPAMRMLLKKLSVDNYNGLVAASSIIRPGVAKSGMMREYILRHKNPKLRKNAHPVMQDIMPDTYGIMVYQEDVIKVAHYFADLDLGEADVLRRGMSGKFRSRSEFQKVKLKFKSNCIKKGYAPKTINDIWRQIESFAGYAFAKGHSASYAVESYQSLFLKTYYPLEYMVGVINNGGGFYRAEIYIHEARLLGGDIQAPCINHSHYLTWLQGRKIYLGWHLLHGLESQVAIDIVKEREHNGPYLSLEDFLNRISIGIEQVDILIRIDAFRYTGMDKRSLLWKAHFILGQTIPKTIQNALFDLTPKIHFDLPTFKIEALEHAFDQIELLGFPLCHPFNLLEEPLPPKQLRSVELPTHNNQIVTIYGYLVTIKNTTTSNKKRMQFGTFLDYDGDWIDTVHFPPVAAKYPFRGKGIYKIMGKVIEEFGFYCIEVLKMERMSYVEDVRYSTTSPKVHNRLAIRQ